MPPKVSVITVSYNAVKDIENTIKSVIAQNYVPIEYIIVDGESKDGTVDLIKKYENHISKWISEPDKGLYDAMNKGVKMATGEWVCFMNAGDVFESDTTIQFVFNGFELKNTSVVFGDVVLDYTPYGYVLLRYDKLIGSKVSTEICHQSSFTRRECLLESPFDLRYKIYGDLNTFYSLWKKGCVFKYVPRPIAVFEAFDGLSSKHPEINFHERNQMLKRYWYNSFGWWKALLMLLGKKTKMQIMSQESYKKSKYSRILSQNETYKYNHNI